MSERRVRAAAEAEGKRRFGYSVAVAGFVAGALWHWARGGDFAEPPAAPRCTCDDGPEVGMCGICGAWAGGREPLGLRAQVTAPDERWWEALVQAECKVGHVVFVDDGDGTVYACPVCALADATPTPPRPGEWCPEHIGQPAWNCGPCRADELGRTGPSAPPTIPADQAATNHFGAATVRAAIRQPDARERAAGEREGETDE